MKRDKGVKRCILSRVYKSFILSYFKKLIEKNVTKDEFMIEVVFVYTLLQTRPFRILVILCHLTEKKSTLETS